MGLRGKINRKENQHTEEKRGEWRPPRCGENISMPNETEQFIYSSVRLFLCGLQSTLGIRAEEGTCSH